MQKMEVECPKCREGKMKVVMIPSHLETQRSRGSGQGSSRMVNVPAEYKVLSPCDKCGCRWF